MCAPAAADRVKVVVRLRPAHPHETPGAIASDGTNIVLTRKCVPLEPRPVPCAAAARKARWYGNGKRACQMSLSVLC